MFAGGVMKCVVSFCFWLLTFVSVLFFLGVGESRVVCLVSSSGFSQA